MTGCIYDEFHTAESSADRLQCRFGKCSAHGAHHLLSCLRHSCRTSSPRFFKDRPFFDFTGFEEPKSRDTDPNLMLRYLKNLWRNVKATGLYFLFGVLLSALFQRYVPADFITSVRSQ